MRRCSKSPTHTACGSTSAAPSNRRLRHQPPRPPVRSLRRVQGQIWQVTRRASPRKPRVLTCSPGRRASWTTGSPTVAARCRLSTSSPGGLVVESTLIRRLRRYCDELAFPEGLDLHSVRRSYATHLLEDGWDPMFVRHQMGHEHASTTGIYQFVSTDFCNTLRGTVDTALGRAPGEITPDTHSRLHLAPGRADGRAGAAQHHRPDPLTCRTRHCPDVPGHAALDLEGLGLLATFQQPLKLLLIHGWIVRSSLALASTWGPI